MSHLELVQQMFHAIGNGDMPTLERILDEDLTFTLAGTSSFAGRTTGRASVLELLGRLQRELAISNAVRGCYEGPAGVIVHQTGTAAGYEDESLVLFKIHDGRISHAVEFLFDVASFDRYAATATTAANISH